MRYVSNLTKLASPAFGFKELQERDYQREREGERQRGRESDRERGSKEDNKMITVVARAALPCTKLQSCAITYHACVTACEKGLQWRLALGVGPRSEAVFLRGAMMCGCSFMFGQRFYV